jgi:hypothetical protein
MRSFFIDGLVDVVANKQVSVLVMRLSLGVKSSSRSSQPLTFIDSGGVLAPNSDALFQKELCNLLTVLRQLTLLMARRLLASKRANNQKDREVS